MAFLKYPGGKHSELPIIRKYVPENIEKYFEPFVGGGAVYFDVTANEYHINDKSEDLIALYKSVRNQDEDFFALVQNISNAWDNLANFVEKNKEILTEEYIRFRDDFLTDTEIKWIITGFICKNHSFFIDLVNIYFKSYADDFCPIIEKYWIKKFQAMKKLEEKKHLPEEDIIPNIECAIKTGYYMFLRTIYNKYLTNKISLKTGEIAALYLFIRETTYSSMFRFNSAGEFNVPYGGISYNSKDLASKIKQYKEPELINKLKLTDINCEDFEVFMAKQTVGSEDFLFIDPPYDSDFSEYDKSKFEHNDQERLANYLINQCDGKFMVVIKYTPYIASLYQSGTMCKNGQPLDVIMFDKKYAVSFMNRNDKDVEHMLIKNY